MKKLLTTEHYNLLAVHRLFNFNGENHYLQWASADESKPYGTEFYLVPVSTPTEKRVEQYFKTIGIEVTMETLEQTVIN